MLFLDASLLLDFDFSVLEMVQPKQERKKLAEKDN